MAVTLLQALPRPIVNQPAVGRSRVASALAMIRELAPHDVTEAHLVPQIVLLTEPVPQPWLYASLAKNANSCPGAG